MILLGSTPQLALMTTLGSACSILVLNSLDANPLYRYKNQMIRSPAYERAIFSNVIEFKL